MRIDAEGSVMATEIITVNAEGLQISHGIYRDFPTTYTSSSGGGGGGGW